MGERTGQSNQEEQSEERVFAPAYLWEFRCDGAACESHCCRDWRIPVDAAAWERLARLPSKDRKAVFTKLVEKDETGWETRHNEDGACAFLDEDGLCSLQKRHGETYLPDICDSYPRVSYRFGDYVERSLAMTCPVAARLALLPDSPMRFEERSVPARRASSLTHPPMEALLIKEKLRALQLQMIAILQDRTRSLRLRFLHLGRFLAVLESRYGNRLPDAEVLAACAENIKPAAETRSRGPSYTRLRYMGELMAALYEAEENYTPGRLNELAACLSECETESEKLLHSIHGHILENLAVNELFLRLYPFSCAGGFLANFKLFVLRFRAAEFPLLLKASSKNTQLDVETVLLLLGRIMEKLDHNRATDELLKRRAAEDFDEMEADEVMSFL